MSTYVFATCENGIVKVGNAVISEAQILSNGVGKSTGILILDGPTAFYLPSSALDIGALIERLSDIVGKLVEIATGLDAVTTAPGSQAAQIALLSAMQVELLATKETLI